MATTSPLKLSVDRQGKTLLSKTGFANGLPDQFQSNEIDIEVEVCDPPSLTTQSNPLDMGSFGMRVSVGATPTGTAGGPTPLALATLTWNPATSTPPSRFVGTLALNTVAVDSYLGGLSEKDAYFEINLTIASRRITILQSAFKIKAVVDELTSLVPTPVDTYMTKNETLATCLRKVMLPGETINTTSPDGTSWGVEIAVDNNGSVQLNAVKLT